MGGFSRGNDAPTQYTFARNRDSQLGRLCNDGSIRKEIFAQFLDAKERKLFVDNGGQNHIAGWFFTARMNGGDCVHHRRQSGFGITRTSAIYASAMHRRLKRWYRHSLDRDRIHMSFEQHFAARIDSRKANDNVLSGFGGFVRIQNMLSPRFDSANLEEFLDIAS